MYLYQPCLLTLSLYAWACDRRRLRIWFVLLVLAISGWEMTHTRIWLYPAALLLPLVFVFHRPVWSEVLTAAVLGGLVSWKAADIWPLSPLLMPLCSLLIMTSGFLCRSREDRLLAFCLCGLFYEMFFCLREYVLFSFCVIRLGSRSSLCLSTAVLCIYLILEEMIGTVRNRKMIESKKSACIFRSDVYN